jgi:hypothetical protein
MDCSSISEEDHRMIVESVSGKTLAQVNVQPPCASAALQLKLPSQSVPRLNMDGLTQQCHVGFLSTHLHQQGRVKTHLPSSSKPQTQHLAMPDWDKKRAPGAPPPSGATESAKIDCCLQIAAEPTSRRRDCALSDPGEIFSSRTTNQSMPTFRHYLGHALSDSGLGDSLTLSTGPVAAATGHPPGASTLTFRDLLPAQLTPRSVTPISRLAHHSEAISAEQAHDCSGGSTPDTPVPGDPVSCRSDERHKPLGLSSIAPAEFAEQNCIVEETGSPCMSCTPATLADAQVSAQMPPCLGSPCSNPVHRLPPGSVLSNSGNILEAPESPCKGSPVSPPSMTPPAADVTRSWSEPAVTSCDVHIHPPNKENASWLAQAESHLQARPKRQAPTHTVMGNTHVRPVLSSNGKLLRCLSASNAGPLQASMACATGSNKTFDSSQTSHLHSSSNTPSAAETSAWRARHFRKLTDSRYFTDELIMEAMKASQQAPCLSVHPTHRCSVYAAPLEHSERHMLAQAGSFRSASAPPGSANFDDSTHMAPVLPSRPGSSLMTYSYIDCARQLAPIAEPLQEGATSPDGKNSAAYDRCGSLLHLQPQIVPAMRKGL